MQHWIKYEEMNKGKINKADELIKIQKTLLQYIEHLEDQIQTEKQVHNYDTKMINEMIEQ